MALAGRLAMTACMAQSSNGAASTSGRGAEPSWAALRPARPFLPRPLQLLRHRPESSGAGLGRRCGALQVAALAPKREMSVQQRVRIARALVAEQWRQVGTALSALPPVGALLQLLALLDRKLQPLYALVGLLKAKLNQLGQSYSTFLAEETRRRWSWENMNAREIAFYRAVPRYLFLMGSTVLYELFLPVSVTFALLLPLYFAWVIWDDWWRSPLFVGMAIMAPIKFVPWAEMCWIWPGII